MFIKKIFFVVLFTLLSGCGNDNNHTLNEDDIILAFGDSLTEGVGSKESSYPKILEQLSGVKVVNAGISGETTSEGLARFSTTILKYNPALVVLLEGGNDILRNKNLKNTKQNLSSMIKFAQENGVKVVLIGVPEKKLFSSSANLYEELAEEFSVPFDGESLSNLLRQPKYKSDMVHLNDEGYRALAINIHDLLIDEGYLK
ncbi:GDSL-type esterase/lipase family protein [Microbulbifer sp. JMSA003]|uniref:GDSL-type esterase/lipase family protein n=1 Tax=Microbulbifer sp. JMSA003 TaxID=3243369 RepID=UPI004039553C